MNELGTVDTQDILLGEDVLEEMQEPLVAEFSKGMMNVLEKARKYELKKWYMAECIHCHQNFNLISCRYIDGNAVCSNCKKIN